MDYTSGSSFKNKTGINKVFKEQPIKLLEVQSGKIKFEEEALTLLRNIEQEVIVVTALGKHKCGKSFLLNLLLDHVGDRKGVNNSMLTDFSSHLINQNL